MFNSKMLSLFNGAALGAAAMFLMDPVSGRRRRTVLSDKTASAIDSAREYSADSVATLSEQAGVAGHSMMKHAKNIGRSISSAVHNAAPQKSAFALLAPMLEHRASITKGIKTLARKAPARKAGFVAAAPVSHTAGLAGLLLVGAGVMYFCDPRAGRRRRALARDKAVRAVHEVGDAFNSAGKYCRHLMNRSYGIAHEAKKAVGLTAPRHRETVAEREPADAPLM